MSFCRRCLSRWLRLVFVTPSPQRHPNEPATRFVFQNGIIFFVGQMGLLKANKLMSLGIHNRLVYDTVKFCFHDCLFRRSDNARSAFVCVCRAFCYLFWCSWWLFRTGSVRVQVNVIAGSISNLVAGLYQVIVFYACRETQREGLANTHAYKWSLKWSLQ